MSEEIFKKVSNYIVENRSKHEKQIKEFYVREEVCSFQEFIKGYEGEAKAIDSETTKDTLKDSCSISTFKEFFLSFEKYPPNLQKPKKHHPKDLNRTMAISRAQSMSDMNTSNCSIISLDKTVATAEKWEKGLAAVEIYNDYRKFKRNIKMLEEQLKDDMETKFSKMLQKIRTIAKEIDKIYANENNDLETAFTHEDAEMMRQFNDNVEKAIYVQENQRLFKDDETSQPHLENVIELLDYWFDAIGHFREI